MKIRWCVFLIVMLLTFSCAQEDNSVATNKATAEHFTNEVWNAGNVDMLDELVTEDYVLHYPASADTPVINGREAMKEYVANAHKTYPDIHIEPGYMLAEGDLLAASWTVTGTHAE